MPESSAATEITYTGVSSDTSNGLPTALPPVSSCYCLPGLPHHVCLARLSRSSRGSSPAVASRNDSRASRAAPFSLSGTWTVTVTSRAPLVPSLRRTPLPGARNVRPLGVPAGMRMLTGVPRSVGTLISAPSAASVTVTGTVTVRLSPDLPKMGCGVTCTRTYKSPGGPPCSPDVPLPLSRIRCPSATPAGMRAWMVRVLMARPLPEHAWQGSSTTRPRPRHSLHGSENAKLPRFRLDWPVPWQVGQTLGTDPDFAPVPRQVGHAASPVSRSPTVVPSMASVKDSVASVSTSAPRRGRVCCEVRPPNIPPKRSPTRPPLEPAVVSAPPKMSPRSNGKLPAPPAPGDRKPPPNSERASSYSLRCLGSDSTLFASEISLNRSSALASPLLASGWYLRASFRYDFLISSGVAVLETPRTL